MRKTKTIQKVQFLAPDVKKWFDYDQATGLLIWKLGKRKVTKGSVAGCYHVLKSKDYRRVNVSVDCKRYLLSRIIWLWMTGEWPKGEVDHIDGDGWNNKWDNLRDVTHNENGKNRGINKNHSLGVNGVSFTKGGKKYRARITVNRKEIYLGEFDTVAEAAVARKKASIKYFGEFARANA